MSFDGKYERICIICGEPFVAKHNRRLICYRDHYRTCVICGKQFVCNSNPATNSRNTCSEECRRKAISKNSTSGEKKYKHTCRICGTEYYSSVSGDRDLGICDQPHTKICEVCGESFVITDKHLYDSRKTCSNRCRYISSVQTWKQNEAVHMQHQKEIIHAKYGVDCVFQLPEIQEKSKQTCLEKYGAEKYTKTQEFKDRLIAHNQEAYGVDWYMQTPEYWDKARATWTEKYGVDNPSKSASVIREFVTDPSKIDALMQFRENPRQFVESTFGSNLPTLQELADVCGIRDSSVGWILNQTNNQDLVAYVYSYMEQEMFDFLTTLVDPSRIERNTHQIITPYELDLYLSDYKLGIECNPTSTHNSTYTGWGEDSHTDKNYHRMKTDISLKNGIFLFHVFGYEWNHKKEIIQSMIRNLLGVNLRRVYARNTQVREVSFKDANDFLDANHRQGKAVSKIRLGLYQDDELVSLMTFGTMRNTLGTGKSNLDDCYELVRFCNKLNTSVIGGASKLFSYFVKIYSPERVRSFSDRAHTKGSLYTVLGFDCIHESDPGYVWVDTRTDIAFSRVNAQKQNIKKFLKDDTIDLSKTEVEIMVDHKFVQVYDSGTVLWEWRR